MAEEKKTKKKAAPKKAAPKKTSPRANNLTEGQTVTHPKRGCSGRVVSVGEDTSGNQWVNVLWDNGTSSDEYTSFLSS